MNHDTLFIYLWLGLSLVALAFASAFLIWAYRTGQFKDQERARHLALDEPTENELRAEKRKKNAAL